MLAHAASLTSARLGVSTMIDEFAFLPVPLLCRSGQAGVADGLAAFVPLQPPALSLAQEGRVAKIVGFRYPEKISAGALRGFAPLTEDGPAVCLIWQQADFPLPLMGHRADHVETVISRAVVEYENLLDRMRLQKNAAQPRWDVPGVVVIRNRDLNCR